MKKLSLLVPMLVAALWAPTARAVPVVEDKEKGLAINVGALIQPTFQMTMSGANPDTGPCGGPPAGTDRCSPGIGNPRGDGPSYDFFIRRARLMLWGSVNKQISFFIDTDEPNLGKGGVWSTTTFVQDAFATYTFMPEVRIDAGLMLVPLSHHTLEGATSLNALDYHADLVRFPTGRIFRDAGLQLRGVAAGDHLHYRLGLFEGVRNGALAALPAPAMGMPAPTRTLLNPGGVPRITAQVRGNILGVEPDFFFKGIYFSKTPIISVGVGYDFQPNSVIKLDQTHGNYMAASVDAFVEYPFTEADELIVKGNFFWYGEGVTTLPGSAMVPSGAIGAYGEVGFRHDWIEPVVFIDILKGNKGKTAENPSDATHAFQMAPTISSDIMAPHVGVNFWVMKHNFNIKTDIGYKKTERTQLAVHNLAANTTTLETKLAPQQDILWTTQMQMFF